MSLLLLFKRGSEHHTTLRSILALTVGSRDVDVRLQITDPIVVLGNLLVSVARAIIIEWSTSTEQP